MAKGQLTVVHVDDEFTELKHVESEFKKGTRDHDFEIISIKSLADFKTFLQGSKKPDAVILDVHFKNEKQTGIDYVPKVRSRWPNAAVIVRTTDYDQMDRAITCGAHEFIGKESFEREICYRTVKTVALIKERAGRAKGATAKQSGFEVIGETMQAVAARASRIVDSAVRVVHVSGESGAGKEVVADIFQSMTEEGTPFVRVNCGAISPDLFEAEIFGAKKGAYTNAVQDRKGFLEAASGGWLYLDEIATMPLQSQVKLLRVIDNQEFMRLGDNEIYKVDVRIITATNENLANNVKDGKFRNDLLQRLREAEIFLPPLRERPNEIKPLIEFFAKNAGGGPYKVTEPVMRALCRYGWEEGNVRELRNCIRAMTENHVDKMLTPMSIPKSFWERAKDVESADDDDGDNVIPIFDDKSLTVRWTSNEIPSHAHLADLLLFETVRLICHDKKKSLRDLELIIGLSRTTLSDRLRGMVDRRIATAAELKRYVKLRV